MTSTFAITPRGLFSLREAALFGFGPRSEKHFDGVMRLAFCLDSYQDQVGVELRQSPDGVVHGICSLRGPAVRDQVARVLGLDRDGDDFHALRRVDPVLGRVLSAAPGLRPVLFYSPYEAAVWSIISARRALPQAIVLRDRLSRAHGAVFTVAGVEQAALPLPAQLLDVTGVPWLPAARIPWLHAVARAALDGELDAATLAAADPEAAMARLRRLPGIGPFYAALIQIRATGVTDVLPTNEPRVLACAGELYGPGDGQGGPMSPTEFEQRAEAWRPWRTWATVLIRAATHRVAVGPGAGRR